MAREYFSALLGNKKTKTRLANAIVHGTLPHAFLIIGDRGTGKRTLARELCAALNCESTDGGAPLPCGACNNCRRIREGTFPDIKKLSRDGSKATIGVGETKLFKEDMFLSPTESKKKIYIIEEADRLTVNAQNALLTVLEEPPSGTLILLLSETGDKILSTIKSRAESIFTERFSEAALRRYLISNNEAARALDRTDPEALTGIILSAGGSIGRAETLLSPKEAERSKAEREIIERILKGARQNAPYSELYIALSALPTGREALTDILETLMTALRDLVVIKRDESAQLLYFTSAKAAESFLPGMGTARLMDIYGIINDAREDVSQNVGISAITANLGARIRLI